MRRILTVCLLVLVCGVARPQGFEGVALVYCPNNHWLGTGAFVSKRKVLTAGHIIIDIIEEMTAKPAKITKERAFPKGGDVLVSPILNKGMRVRGRALYIDPAIDIAVVELEREIPTVKPFKVSFKIPPVGITLPTYGGLEEQPIYMKRMVSGHLLTTWGATAEVSAKVLMLCMQCPSVGGTSGSPILYEGAIVALLVGSDRGFSLGTLLSNLTQWGRYFLERW